MSFHMGENISITTRAAFVGGVFAGVATVLGLYVYNIIKKNKIPTEWREVGKVRKLCIYPLKSGKRKEVNRAECTKQGLMETEKLDSSLKLRDRSFVLYHAQNYEYRTARHFPQLILIELEAHDKDYVTFNAPNMLSLLLRIPNKETNEEVVIKHDKGEEIMSIDCGDEAAKWISKYVLGNDSGLRIAYHDGSYKRTQINRLHKDAIDYYKRGLRNESGGLTSDLTAMHIINDASVQDVNSKLNNTSVTTDNFRPNLVVSGANLQPFEEDNWQWIKAGDVIMKNVAECTRCTIPLIDYESGIRNKQREPLKTMEKYRISKGPQKTPVMGILLEVFQTGFVSIGDTVYVSK